MRNVFVYRTIVVLCIIMLMFSLIDGFIVIPKTIPMLVVVLFSLTYCIKAFANKQTIALLLYLFVLLFNFFCGSNIVDYPWIAKDFLIPFSCLSIINVFLYKRDYKGLKIVIMTGLLVFIFVSLPTLLLLNKDPDILRSTTSLAEDNPEELILLAGLGLMTIGVIQSLPFIIPSLIYLIKNEGKIKNKLAVSFLVVLIYYLVLKASFATSIILGSLGIFYSIFISTKFLKPFFYIFGLISLFFFINENSLLSTLDSIQPIFEDSAVYEKITEIKSSIIRGKVEGQAIERRNLYNKSWDSFLENPLIGDLEVRNVGGHSFFIDRLAYFGILGFLPFFIFLFYNVKNIYKLLLKNQKKYYSAGVIMFVFLAFMKNIAGFEPFFYFIVLLPGLFITFNINSSKV